MSKHEKADLYESILSWLVDQNERRPHNQTWAWNKRDIDHVKMGFSLMTEKQRAAFLEKYRNYQIAQILRKEYPD